MPWTYAPNADPQNESWAPGDAGEYTYQPDPMYDTQSESDTDFDQSLLNLDGLDGSAAPLLDSSALGGQWDWYGDEFDQSLLDVSGLDGSAAPMFDDSGLDYGPGDFDQSLLDVSGLDGTAAPMFDASALGLFFDENGEQILNISGLDGYNAGGQAPILDNSGLAGWNPGDDLSFFADGLIPPTVNPAQRPATTGSNQAGAVPFLSSGSSSKPTGASPAPTTTNQATAAAGRSLAQQISTAPAGSTIRIAQGANAGTYQKMPDGRWQQISGAKAGRVVSAAAFTQDSTGQIGFLDQLAGIVTATAGVIDAATGRTGPGGVKLANPNGPRGTGTGYPVAIGAGNRGTMPNARGQIPIGGTVQQPGFAPSISAALAQITPASWAILAGTALIAGILITRRRAA